MSQTNPASAKTEVGNTFLRHALTIWAREQGVAEPDLSDVARDVLSFAQSVVRDNGGEQALSA